MNRFNLVSGSAMAPAGCGLLVLALLGLPACSGGSPGDRDNRGPFQVSLISTGLGQIFPYRIRESDNFGNPTTTVLNIENIDTLKLNTSPNNGVLPVATFDTTATLPSGGSGNQFLLMQFSHKLTDPDQDGGNDIGLRSILNNGVTNSGLTTAVSLLTYDPVSEATAVISGRGFVGGRTIYPGQTEPVQVAEEGGGSVVISPADPSRGFTTARRAELLAGWPRGFSGDVDLVDKKSFVFIPDSDNDIATHETFPTSALLRIIVSNSVRDTEDKVLEHEVYTATTVGPDPTPPDVLGAPSAGPVSITPGNGESNVDPTTTVLVRFNKPVQPTSVGTFFDPQNLIPSSGGVTISVTAAAQTFDVIYYADPLGFGDFMNYLVRPAYNLPGQAQVVLAANNTAIAGLDGRLLQNTANTDFDTGDGPGLVNAPVAPEVVYVGIGGAEPGVSIIDLNGFGQGTGDVNNTRFPLNPNVGAPGVIPALAPGLTNLDAGGAGALTLTQDTTGNTHLIGSPMVGQIGDIQIGAPLDLVFNNENINVNASRANQLNLVAGTVQPGNTISIAPHPNPPRLVFPPPNPASSIFGEEPTISTAPTVTASPPCAPSPINLLSVGNPFATTQGSVGIYGGASVGVFLGPQPPPAAPPPPTPSCPFASRQQVGHFLYVLDRDNRQVLIMNSNRMTVLDTIRLSDPYSMSVAPNLSTLAVSNFSSSTVTFIDINPLSPTFHTIVGETRVEEGPTLIAFQPDGEDILVVCSSSNSVTILRGLDLQVRKVITGFLNAPIEISITPRYSFTGNLSNVYYAYILNANGTIAIYESGPSGVNGFGFDDIIGIIDGVTFRRAKRIIPDFNSFLGAFYIGHVDDNDLGQVSRVELTSTPIGALPVQQNQGGFIVPPTFRQKDWTVVQAFGGANPTTPRSDFTTGNAIVDIATDDILNFGALPGAGTAANANIQPPAWGHSGKHALKVTPTGAIIPATSPKLLFIALGDTGKVDVFDLSKGDKIQTLDVPGVTVLATYWRQ